MTLADRIAHITSLYASSADDALLCFNEIMSAIGVATSEQRSPEFSTANGRTVCDSAAGRRWRCSCGCWSDWAQHVHCSVCGAARDVTLSFEEQLDEQNRQQMQKVEAATVHELMKLRSENAVLLARLEAVIYRQQRNAA